MKKKCVYCGKEFETYDKRNHHSRRKLKRAKNCLTCSKKCSFEYNGERDRKGGEHERQILQERSA